MKIGICAYFFVFIIIVEAQTLFKIPQKLKNQYAAKRDNLTYFIFLHLWHQHEGLEHEPCTVVIPDDQSFFVLEHNKRKNNEFATIMSSKSRQYVGGFLSSVLNNVASPDPFFLSYEGKNLTGKEAFKKATIGRPAEAKPFQAENFKPMYAWKTKAGSNQIVVDGLEVTETIPLKDNCLAFVTKSLPYNENIVRRAIALV